MSLLANVNKEGTAHSRDPRRGTSEEDHVAETAKDSRPPVPTERGRKTQARFDEEMARIFSGRRWRVLREIRLGPDEKFVTIFGRTARKGVVLAEIGNPTNLILVGYTVLARAAQMFDAIETIEQSPPAPVPEADEEPSA